MLQTSLAAAMTSHVLPKIKNKYILLAFYQACASETFHDKWMTAETWAESICRHYQLPKALKFNGASLNHAISSNNGLCLAMDVAKDNVPLDHCGMFCTSYKPVSKASTR